MTEEKRISFAVFTKVWNALPLAELAEMVAGMGFDGVELPVRPGAQVEPQNVGTDLPIAAKLLGRHGLQIHSVAGPIDEPTIAACAEAGVPIIRTQVAVKKGEYRASEARARRTLEALVPALDRYGVTIGIQNHYGWNIPNALGLLHLIENFDPKHVAAVWDAVHAALAGEEPEMGLDILWPHLCMVNLKNGFWERTNGPEAEWVQWRNHMTTGRQGLASWPRVAEELKRRDYRGVICLSAIYHDRSMAKAQRLTPEDLAFAKSLFA